MNKEKIKKVIEHLQKLVLVSERDEMVYGESYIEFSDRKIKVIEPSKAGVKYSDHIQVYKREQEGVFYGKSILGPVK